MRGAVMTKTSATSALDFARVPATLKSRSCAGGVACRRAGAIPSAIVPGYRSPQSFQCEFPSTTFQRRRFIPCAEEFWFAVGGMQTWFAVASCLEESPFGITMSKSRQRQGRQV